jgi:hypothetical protein
MITKTMKWISAVALVALLPLLWGSPLSPATLVLAVLVWGGAIVVLVQAASARKYFWAVGFALIFVSFNPFVPLMFSRRPLIALDLFSMAAFLSSLVFLKTAPRLSIASVTDTDPRSEAL